MWLLVKTPADMCFVVRLLIDGRWLHRKDTKKQRPRFYRVMLHNDNYNRREYVVQVLLKVIPGMTVDDAVNVMQARCALLESLGFLPHRQTLLCCFVWDAHVTTHSFWQSVQFSCLYGNSLGSTGSGSSGGAAQEAHVNRLACETSCAQQEAQKR